jgi:hypothetical protein
VFLNDIPHNSTHKYRGFETEFLIIVSKVTNTTLKYFPAPPGSAVEQGTTTIMKLYFGEVDVALGTIVLHLNILQYADATIPYLQTAFQWFVPCPTPVPRMERILGIFTVHVWLALVLVLAVTTAVVWGMGARQCESPLYSTASSSVYNVWAIFIGVSVTELPRTSRLRIFFLIFIWYSLVMNIVFQAFFVTFLVEPGFHQQIATFDELVDSGVTYAFDESSETGLNISEYYDHMKLKSRRLKCPHHEMCLEHLIVSHNITMISTQFQADYRANEILPNYQKSKHLCSLDQDIYKMFFVMYLQLGSPLLDRFNSIIRRSIEAGLVDNYWSMLKWKRHVKSTAKSVHDSHLGDNDEYFALSLSHLKVAFFILTLGHVLSSITFIGELLYTIAFRTQHVGLTSRNI